MSSSITVNILFFARAREITGVSETAAQLPNNCTLADALEFCKRRFPDLQEYLNSTAVLFAVNQEYARSDSKLSEGAEIAILPPVSGG